MKAFKDVIDSCFTSKELLPDYEAKIDAFSDAVKLVKATHDMTISPKQHIICEHVKPFCRKFNAPLGKFSEHEVESCHYSFEKVWQRYLVKDYTNPQFAKEFLRAVIAFNSENMN